MICLIKNSYQLDPYETEEKLEKESEPIYYKNKSEIVEVLKQAVFYGENMSTQKQHIENINDMLGKDRIFD